MTSRTTRHRRGSSHLSPLKEYSSPITAVAQSQGRIAFGAEDGSVHYGEPLREEMYEWIVVQTSHRKIGRLGQTTVAICMRFVGNWLMWGSTDGCIRIWNIRKRWTDFRPIECGRGTVVDITAMLHKGDSSAVVFAAIAPDRLEIWNLESEKEPSRLYAIDVDKPRCLTISKDDALLVVGAGTGREMHQRENTARFFAIVPSTNSDGSLLSIMLENRVLSFQQPDGAVAALAFSSDGNLLLVVSEKGAITAHPYREDDKDFKQPFQLRRAHVAVNSNAITGPKPPHLSHAAFFPDSLHVALTIAAGSSDCVAVCSARGGDSSLEIIAKNIKTPVSKLLCTDDGKGVIVASGKAISIYKSSSPHFDPNAPHSSPASPASAALPLPSSPPQIDIPILPSLTSESSVSSLLSNVERNGDLQSQSSPTVRVDHSQPHYSEYVGKNEVGAEELWDTLHRVFKVEQSSPRDFTRWISKGDFIGAGGCGVVFHGKWNPEAQAALGDREPCKVAVKELMRVRGGLRREWGMEVKIWQNLRHPNIVPFIGIAYLSESTTTPCLLSLYMPNGSLRTFIRKRPIASPELYLIQIAQAIQYLHDLNPVIVHGDIKTDNVLIDRNGCLRLTDFGLCRVVVDGVGLINTMSTIRGTAGWMAPELIKDRKVTTKSDIYAFGVTIWEIVTGEIPFKKTYLAIPILVVEQAKRPEIPFGVNPRIAELIRWCWHQDPQMRPDIHQVLNKLEEMVKLRGSESLPPTAPISEYAASMRGA